MDIAMVGAAYNGLKFAKDALKLSLDLKVESESRAQVHAALEKLGSVQDSLFELREELFKLQSENEHLRRELKSRDEWGPSRLNMNFNPPRAGQWYIDFLVSRSITLAQVVSQRAASRFFRTAA